MNTVVKKAESKSSPLETIQKHYRQRDLAAKEWKKKGGKVAGYFCTHVPDELILAAGFFPFRLSGNPGVSTEKADKYAEPYYESQVRSMFNMLLTGQYDFLDFLIIPHSRDSITALFNYVDKIKSIEPEIKLPELYLFDTPRTNLWLSDLYYHDRLRDFKNKLEEWSGKKILPKALSEAIYICNQNRMLLKQVASLRAADPPRISGVEALQIIGSSMFMLKEEQINSSKTIWHMLILFPKEMV
jgi:benzoyl-CoA reductase subunit C